MLPIPKLPVLIDRKQTIQQLQNGWRVEHTQINVEQGDSSLILIKNGNNTVKSILIDCGQENAEKYGKNVPHHLYNTLQNKIRGKQLDAIIITHWDSDHCGGYNCQLLKGVLDKYGNTEIKYNKFYKIQQKIGINFSHIGISGIFETQHGQILQPISLIDKYLGRSFENILIPNEIDIEFLSVDNCFVGTHVGSTNKYQQIKEREHKLTNLSSIGLLVKSYGKTILTCGDIGTRGSYFIKQYLSTVKIPKVTVLKLNHHGSRNNTFHHSFCLPDFDISLISFGEINHSNYSPNQGTIEILIELINTTMFTSLTNENASQQNKRVICTNWPQKLMSDAYSRIIVNHDYKYLDFFKYLECVNVGHNIEICLSENSTINVFYGDRVIDVHYNEKHKRISLIIYSEFLNETHECTKVFTKQSSSVRLLFKIIATIDKTNNGIAKLGSYDSRNEMNIFEFDGINKIFKDTYYNIKTHQIEVTCISKEGYNTSFQIYTFKKGRWLMFVVLQYNAYENKIYFKKLNKTNNQISVISFTHPNTFKGMVYNKQKQQSVIIYDDNKRVTTSLIYDPIFGFISEQQTVDTEVKRFIWSHTQSHWKPLN
ncbi:DNA internalization-related competence protein ComEC/Rec2 [Entamoeba marina]